MKPGRCTIRVIRTARRHRSARIRLCVFALTLYTMSSAIVLPPALAMRPNDARLRATELLKSGEHWYQYGDTETALGDFERALELARQTDDPLLLSDCLIALSRAHLARNELESAQTAAREALFAARMAGDRGREARALDQVGNVYYDLDDPERALDYFQASLEMTRDSGNRLGEARALKDVGITYRRVGRYEESLQACNKALAIFGGLGDTYSALSVLENIGTCYAKLGAYDLAMQAYQESLEIAREKGYHTATIEVLIWTGYLCSDIGEHERALECFREAAALAERLRRHRNQGWALMGMSASLNALGQRGEAIEATRRSLAINRQFGTWKGIADNIRDLGNLHLDSDPVAAAHYYRKALTFYDRYHKELVWAPYDGLARAERRAGALDQAVRHFETAIDRIEAVRGKLSLDQYKATFSAAHQRIYHDLIEVLIEQHQKSDRSACDARAFELFEKTKARSMAEVLAEAQSNSPRQPPAELADRKQQLESRIGLLHTSLVQSAQAEGRREIVDELNQAERELDAVMVGINQSRRSATSMPAVDSLSLAQVQQSLDSQTALVAYLLTDDHSYVFVVTATTFNVEQLETPPRLLTSRIENYVELLDANSDGWQDISRRLYRDLLRPVRAHLASGIDRLIIVPDGALHFLPFETLIRSTDDEGVTEARKHNENAEHRYLLEDFTVSYSPSATVLKRLSTAAPASSTENRADILLFADPSLAPALTEGRLPIEPAEWTRTLYEQEGLRVSSIPFSNAEAQSVMRRAGPGSKLFAGDEATEARAKTEQLDRFRVIHFATHGLISQQAPLRSALVLAAGKTSGEDGFLQAREVCQLRLSSDLVVLSACRTARGRILAGEGVEGLAGAFFHAGAKSVVASLWDVTDAGTATLMSSFYDHLSNGLSKSDALRAAKLEMLRNPGTAPPRYWAPFVLIGEGVEQVPLGAGASHGRGTLWVLLGVISIVAAFAFYWNRRYFGFRIADLGFREP